MRITQTFWSSFHVAAFASFLRATAGKATLLLFSVSVLVADVTMAASSPEDRASLARVFQPKQLSLADRIAYQRAIEEVYWRHRIWPGVSPGSKPSLEEVMPPARLEQKVKDYVRNSQALEDYWQQPIRPEQLQAEMERMAQRTRQPEVLRELFAALGNDPFVIAECLARPVLSERLAADLYAHDERFHGELKRRAAAELRTHRNVKQMKRTSGKYSETEWIRSDEAESASIDTKNVGAVKMNGSEWDESIQKLAAQFGKNAWDQIKPDVVNPLQENDRNYYAMAVTKKSEDRLKVATVAWPKESFESWAARTGTEQLETTDEPTIEYTLPEVGDPSPESPTVACTDDTWTATSTTNAPSARMNRTAVWTGSEMIVWGGYDGTLYVNTGARYTPGTDSWVATSTTNAPTGRIDHTAVWTGTEMIAWGGANTGGPVNTGGKYNPITNSWTPTSITSVPAARTNHTAVWTGSEMIVWGG
jgi:hypothetical protein